MDNGAAHDEKQRGIADVLKDVDVDGQTPYSMLLDGRYTHPSVTAILQPVRKEMDGERVTGKGIMSNDDSSFAGQRRSYTANAACSEWMDGRIDKWKKVPSI